MSKPAEIHKLEGTFRPDRHSDEIKAPMMARVPQPPDWLNERAGRIWKTKCIDLKDMGLLYRTDQELLGNYCALLADIEEAREKINEALSPEVKLKWMKIHNEALKFAYPMTKDFGFSPLARTKIKVTDKKEDDPIDGI